jgi:hypothetical protein
MGLLKRAVIGVNYPRATPLEIARYVRENIGRSEWGVFVGFESGDPKAIVIAILPCPFMIAPQIPLAYNEGSRALFRTLGARLRQWIVDNGYEDALGINLHHSEAAFRRVFAHFGASQRFGEVIRFNLGGP